MTIICGYQGIGKTTYCKTHTDSYDLDSSAFEKNEEWAKTYVDSAIEVLKSGYDKVFISAHQCVINEILNRILNEISIVVVIPKETKETWEARLRFRYEQCKKQYAYNALQDFLKHFDEDMQYYNQLKNNKRISLIEVTAKVQTNLSELLF